MSVEQSLDKTRRQPSFLFVHVANIKSFPSSRRFYFSFYYYGFHESVVFYKSVHVFLLFCTNFIAVPLNGLGHVNLFACLLLSAFTTSPGSLVYGLDWIVEITIRSNFQFTILFTDSIYRNPGNCDHDRSINIKTDKQLKML